MFRRYSRRLATNIAATAYNVFVLPFKSELKHTDPENNGSDTFPLYKSYLIGLNLSF